MVSAFNLIPPIIIINPIRPAIVVPKLVKIVQNLPHADSAILSITSSLNKFVNDIHYFIYYFIIYIISLAKEFRIIGFSAGSII